jgi:hypothetical protein
VKVEWKVQKFKLWMRVAQLVQQTELCVCILYCVCCVCVCVYCARPLYRTLYDIDVPPM